MQNQAYIIKNQLCRVGNSARLADGDTYSMPFYCTLQQTWRKNKSNFKDKYTPIGTVGTDYYLYIGPFDCDITALSADGMLLQNGQKYEFLKKEAVYVQNQVLYYTGVVRKIAEGSYAEGQ